MFYRVQPSFIPKFISQIEIKYHISFFFSKLDLTPYCGPPISMILFGNVYTYVKPKTASFQIKKMVNIIHKNFKVYSIEGLDNFPITETSSSSPIFDGDD